MMKRKALSWTPRLKGKIYCSSACGGGCTKVQYDKALNSAIQLKNLLQKKIGGNWKIRTRENLGWFSSVSCGTISVSTPSYGGKDYLVLVSLNKLSGSGSGSGVLGKPFGGTDPVKVVKKSIKNLQAYSRGVSGIVAFNEKELGKK